MNKMKIFANVQCHQAINIWNLRNQKENITNTKKLDKTYK